MEQVPILPVLCGQMEDLFGTVRSPLEVPGIASFVKEISSWICESPGKKLVVAGVDLSHDREILDALTGGDASAFFLAGARSRNRYRICGFSTLWTLLAVLPGIRGTVLDYDVWHEEPTRSAVSFAAVAFTLDSPPESPGGKSPSSGESEGSTSSGEER